MDREQAYLQVGKNPFTPLNAQVLEQRYPNACACVSKQAMRPFQFRSLSIVDLFASLFINPCAFVFCSSA